MSISSAIEWLYYLVKPDGRSKYQDKQTGDIKESSTATPLTYAPDGSFDISVAYERDKKRLGMASAVPIPLRFVMDGAKIVRDTLYRLGTEIELYALITKRKVDFSNPALYEDKHVLWWKAPLDLSSAVDEEDKITVKIGEYGLAKKLKAFDSTKFEFELSDPEAINVVHDGMPLAQTSHFLVTKSDQGTAKTKGRHLIGAGLTTTDGEAAGFAGFQVFDNPEPTDLNTSIDYLFATFQDINNMKISGSIDANFFSINSNDINNTVRLDVVLRSNKQPDIALGTYSWQPVGRIGLRKMSAPITFNQTFNGHNGEHFFLVGILTGDSAGLFNNATKVLYLESKFDIQFSSRYHTTSIRAFQPHILLDKIIEKICGKRNKSVSTLLSSLKYKDLVLTSGDGVRGDLKGKVKISFNEFFNTYQICTFGGCSIEKEQLVMEIIDRYLDVTNPIDLGEVSDAKFSVAKDMQGNMFTIGHKEKDSDEVNGKFAFNNTFTWNSKKETVQGELKYVTDAVADPFVIESLRIKYSSMESTDSDGDNMLILLDTVPDQDLSFTARMDFVGGILPHIAVYDLSRLSNFSVGMNFAMTGTASNNRTFTVLGIGSDPSVTTHFVIFVALPITPESAPAATIVNKWNKLKRENYDTITGIPSGNDAFNVTISPKRLMMLWERWINSVFYRMDGQVLTLGTSPRNQDLKTVKAGVTIEEKADFPIRKTIMWKPFWCEVKTPNPISPSLPELMAANPNRCFQFIWEGYTYRMFNWVSACAPDDNKAQVLKGLMTWDTKETNLIR